MGYISEKFLRDFATRQKNYTDNKIEFVSDSIGLDDVSNFSPTKRYAIGERVLYDNKVYKFKVSHKGEWNIDDVDETNLFSEIDDLAKLDYEQVIIELKNENDEVLANVSVTVTVEGEADARNLTTDELGKCTTRVQKGLQYMVSCNDVAGYLSITPLARRAAISTRKIEIVYLIDETFNKEHIEVTIEYSETPSVGAKEIYLSTDNGDSWTTLGLINNKVEFDIDFGVTYIIKFEVLNDSTYVTPKNRIYIAEHHGTRCVTVRYLSKINDLLWLMANGSVKNSNEVTEEDRHNNEIFGLIVNSSDLIDKASSYIIPFNTLIDVNLQISYPYLGKHPNTQTADISQVAIDMCDTDAKCFDESNPDGENIGKYNSKQIRKFVAERALLNEKWYSQAEKVYKLYGGYDEFKSDITYSAGRYVKYNNKIFQFNKVHEKNTGWLDDDVTLIYDTFNYSNNYSIGDKVVYTDGILYEFIKNHIAGTDWDSEEVETAGWLLPDFGNTIGRTEHMFVPAALQAFRYCEQYENILYIFNSIFNIYDILSLGVNSMWSTSSQASIYSQVCVNNKTYKFTGWGASNKLGKSNITSTIGVLSY